MWEKATKPAREIFYELSQKSPQLRNQVYIPLGNKMANFEQQISALLEKDPYTKKMAQGQTIYLSDRAAIEKTSSTFGQSATFIVLYFIVGTILDLIHYVIFGYGDDYEGKGSKNMHSNAMVELERDVAGLRQELRILGVERNKMHIELQRLQHEIGKLNDANKDLSTRLSNQNDTINLLKKQLIIS